MWNVSPLEGQCTYFSVTIDGSGRDASSDEADISKEKEVGVLPVKSAVYCNSALRMSVVGSQVADLIPCLSHDLRLGCAGCDVHRLHIRASSSGGTAVLQQGSCSSTSPNLHDLAPSSLRHDDCEQSCLTSLWCSSCCTVGSCIVNDRQL